MYKDEEPSEREEHNLVFIDALVNGWGDTKYYQGIKPGQDAVDGKHWELGWNEVTDEEEE